jgi:hypothetical protein
MGLTTLVLHLLLFQLLLTFSGCTQFILFPQTSLLPQHLLSISLLFDLFSAHSIQMPLTEFAYVPEFVEPRVAILPDVAWPSHEVVLEERLLVEVDGLLHALCTKDFSVEHFLIRQVEVDDYELLLLFFINVSCIFTLFLVLRLHIFCSSLIGLLISHSHLVLR